MRSFWANIRQLLLPAGAGPGSPAILLTPDVPAELVTFYNTVRGYTIPAVIIKRNNVSNYVYEALIIDAIGTPISAVGSVVAGVVHHERTEHWSIPYGVSALFIGEPGGETVHLHIVTGSALIVDDGAILNLDADAATDSKLEAGFTTDSPRRFALLASGRLEWGSGAATRDVNLYRAAANILASDDQLAIIRAGTSDAAYTAQISTDSQARLVIFPDGGIEWGPGNASRDVRLYRSAADTLKTDDSLVVLGVGDNRSKVKTGDETVNNTATFQNDDELAGFALEANATYRFRHQGVYNTSAVADLKLNYQVPAGASGGYCGQSRVNGTFNNVGLGAGVLQGDGAVSDFAITGWITTGGTAGTLNVQWAQNTAEVSNTTMFDGTQFDLARTA